MGEETFLQQVDVRFYTTEELQKDPSLQEKMCTLFEQAFNSGPYKGIWDKEDAVSFLREDMVREGFIAFFVYHEEKPIAFNWGYQLPSANASGKDFEKMTQQLQDHNIDPQDTFYGAEIGVLPEFRGKGLGTFLIQKRHELYKRYHFVVCRTKNPRIESAYQELGGETLFSFPEETAYKGGRVTVYKLP